MWRNAEKWFQHFHFGMFFFSTFFRDCLIWPLRSMFQILILADIGFGHRERQYIFLHGIVWAWSTSFQTIRKIIRQSNINNCMVQCAGTNRSKLVAHHDVVGMYGRCQSSGGCWRSQKLQVRGRFFKKLYRDGLKLPRRQEADSMTATCWHFNDTLLILA